MAPFGRALFTVYRNSFIIEIQVQYSINNVCQSRIAKDLVHRTYCLSRKHVNDGFNEKTVDSQARKNRDQQERKIYQFKRKFVPILTNIVSPLKSKIHSPTIFNKSVEKCTSCEDLSRRDSLGKQNVLPLAGKGALSTEDNKILKSKDKYHFLNIRSLLPKIKESYESAKQVLTSLGLPAGILFLNFPILTKTVPPLNDKTHIPCTSSNNSIENFTSCEDLSRKDSFSKQNVLAGKRAVSAEDHKVLRRLSKYHFVNIQNLLPNLTEKYESSKKVLTSLGILTDELRFYPRVQLMTEAEIERAVGTLREAGFQVIFSLLLIDRVHEEITAEDKKKSSPQLFKPSDPNSKQISGRIRKLRVAHIPWVQAYLGLCRELDTPDLDPFWLIDEVHRHTPPSLQGFVTLFSIHSRVQKLKEIGATSADILSNLDLIDFSHRHKKTTRFDFKLQLYRETFPRGCPPKPFPVHLFKKEVSFEDFCMQLGIVDPEIQKDFDQGTMTPHKIRTCVLLSTTFHALKQELQWPKLDHTWLIEEIGKLCPSNYVSLRTIPKILSKVKMLKSIGATNEDITANLEILDLNESSNATTGFNAKVRLYSTLFNNDLPSPFPVQMFKKGLRYRDFCLLVDNKDYHRNGISTLLSALRFELEQPDLDPQWLIDQIKQYYPSSYVNMNHLVLMVKTLKAFGASSTDILSNVDILDVSRHTKKRISYIRFFSKAKYFNARFKGNLPSTFPIWLFKKSVNYRDFCYLVDGEDYQDKDISTLVSAVAFELDCPELDYDWLVSKIEEFYRSAYVTSHLLLKKIKTLKSIGASSSDILSNIDMIDFTASYRFDLKVQLYKDTFKEDLPKTFPIWLFKKNITYNNFSLLLRNCSVIDIERYNNNNVDSMDSALRLELDNPALDPQWLMNEVRGSSYCHHISVVKLLYKVQKLKSIGATTSDILSNLDVLSDNKSFSTSVRLFDMKVQTFRHTLGRSPRVPHPFPLWMFHSSVDSQELSWWIKDITNCNNSQVFTQDDQNENTLFDWTPADQPSPYSSAASSTYEVIPNQISRTQAVINLVARTLDLNKRQKAKMKNQMFNFEGFSYLELNDNIESLISEGFSQEDIASCPLILTHSRTVLLQGIKDFKLMLRKQCHHISTMSEVCKSKSDSGRNEDSIHCTLDTHFPHGNEDSNCHSLDTDLSKKIESSSRKRIHTLQYFLERESELYQPVVSDVLQPEINL